MSNRIKFNIDFYAVSLVTDESLTIQQANAAAAPQHCMYACLRYLPSFEAAMPLH